MSWNNIESNWKSLKSTIQNNWPKLSDEDINKIHGNRDLLISAIQEKYVSSRNDAQTEVQNWETQHNQGSPAKAGEQNNDSSDAKYNPDYSGSDSNLTDINKANAAQKKPAHSNEHDEKSLDQT